MKVVVKEYELRLRRENIIGWSEAGERILIKMRVVVEKVAHEWVWSKHRKEIGNWEEVVGWLKQKASI